MCNTELNHYDTFCIFSVTFLEDVATCNLFDNTGKQIYIFIMSKEYMFWSQCLFRIFTAEH